MESQYVDPNGRLLTALQNADLTLLGTLQANGTDVGKLASLNTRQQLLLALKSKIPHPSIGPWVSSKQTSGSRGSNIYPYTVVVGNRSMTFTRDNEYDWEDIIFCTSLHQVPSEEIGYTGNLNVSNDLEVFFGRYPTDLTIADVANLAPENFSPQTSRAGLANSLQACTTRIENEGALEFFLVWTIFTVLEPVVEISFQKHNPGLTFQTVLQSYYDLIERVAAYDLIGLEYVDETASDVDGIFSIVYDLGTQRALRSYSVWGYGDIISSLAMKGPGYGVQEGLPLPLIVGTIIELKRAIFTEEIVSHLVEGSGTGNLMCADTGGNNQFVSGPFSNAFNKTIQQMIRTLCPRGVLIDGQYVLFIQVGKKVNKSGILELELHGPFPLFETEYLRMMFLSFLSLERTLEDLVNEKRELLDLVRDIKTWSVKHGRFNKRSSSTAFATGGDAGSSTHGSSLDTIPEDYNERIDLHDLHTEKGWESADDSRPSSGSTGGLTSTMSAGDSSGDRSSISSALSSMTPTKDAPRMVKELFQIYEINFMRYKKTLVWQSTGPRLSFAFRIDPIFLEAFPPSLLTNSSIAKLKARKALGDRYISKDDWPIIKIVAPQNWSKQSVEDQMERSEVVTIQSCTDSVVREAEMLLKVSNYEQNIVPKVLAHGLMKDISYKVNQNYHPLTPLFDGAFLLLENVGNMVSEEELSKLDTSLKLSIVSKFKKIHEADILHSDIRAENITFKKPEVAGGTPVPYIIDFGNAIEGCSDLSKRSEIKEVESLLKL